MNIVMVGNRDGQASINWPGVILASVMVASVCILGSLALMFALGWFSPVALVLPVVMVLGCIIGPCVRRGLRLPPDQLPPLGRAT